MSKIYASGIRHSLLEKGLMIMLFATSVSNVFAETCPPVDSFTPDRPPVGWSLLPSKYVENETYHFGSAIHSLNGFFYYGQIICVYETCGEVFCPSYAIVSDKIYQKPVKRIKPWDAKITYSDTLRCAPETNDPSECIFLES